MTRDQMVQILIDKGYGRQFAEAQADFDSQHERTGERSTDQCSVCRRWLTPKDALYHYHPRE